MVTKPTQETDIPFFKPHLTEQEISAVAETLRSGWLTTGPQTKEFEREFAQAVKAEYAIALNSCTAALHLAVEALGLSENQAVLVPTMTFAATAEIVLYKNAIPILVDCDPVTGNMDFDDAEDKLAKLKNGDLPYADGKAIDVVGIIPVHVGGYLLDIDKVKDFAERHKLWIVEDAAHAFPAAWRADADSPWQYCGENTADVTCYSFYANKTMTTGEGGMAVTNDASLADRMRLMSLHGLSHDAWGRYSGSGAWDYKIVAPGYKYNLTDIASALGRGQLARAEEMRQQREAIAAFYLDSFAGSAIELPPVSADRIHSWHLFPIRLDLESLTINRDQFMVELKSRGIGCSVHWRPLHLHPLYEKLWDKADLPVATELWPRLISLPISSAMSMEDAARVVDTVNQICTENS